MSVRLFKHINTGRIYKFIGTSRDVKDPERVFVNYSQLYQSKVYGKDIILEKGTVWCIDEKDFYEKFKEGD